MICILPTVFSKKLLVYANLVTLSHRVIQSPGTGNVVFFISHLDLRTQTALWHLWSDAIESTFLNATEVFSNIDEIPFMSTSNTLQVIPYQ